jgi:hypothetical protein
MEKIMENMIKAMLKARKVSRAIQDEMLFTQKEDSRKEIMNRCHIRRNAVMQARMAN